MNRLYLFLALGALFLISSVALFGAGGAKDGSAGAKGGPAATKPAPSRSGGLVSAEEAKTLLETDNTTVLIDVRTAEEFASGRIPGAKLLPYDEIDAQRAAQAIPTKETPVVLYCRSGRRSAIAADALRKLGYTLVYDMGGIGGWKYGLER